VVDDAIRFVSQKAEEKLKPSANSNEEEKESREPDYGEYKDQVEEEQEEQTGEANSTTNQVF
jgi:hypothetical protein